MPLPTGTTVMTMEKETATQSSGPAPVSLCVPSILCIDTRDGSASIYMYEVLFSPMHFCSPTVISTVPYSLLPAISAGTSLQSLILGVVTVAYVSSSCKIFEVTSKQRY